MNRNIIILAAVLILAAILILLGLLFLGREDFRSAAPVKWDGEDINDRNNP